MIKHTIQGSKGKYPYHEGKHLIVAIELYAYGDESGLHADPKYCFLCGFIASPRQWKLFNESWNKILDTYNVPDFHAKDFFARDNTGKRVKNYKDWSNQKEQSFIGSLLNVVQARRIYPIGGAVDVEAFKTIPEWGKRYLTGGAIAKSGKWQGNTGSTQPYHFAFHLFIAEAVTRASEKTIIHFVFDRQNILEEQTIKIFHNTIALSNDPSWKRLGDIIYSDRTHHPGLQVADLYTYVWQSYMTKSAKVDVLNPLARQVLKVFAKRKQGIRIWDKKIMEMALDDSEFTQRQLQRLKQS